MTPLVLIPGFQGRWEYLQPTVDALSRRFRVFPLALAGERTSGAAFDAARGLDNYVDQMGALLDTLHLERAVICGVSFGGLAAIRFAAVHPERTMALVLVSAPGPRPALKQRHVMYARRPWLFGPLFLFESPWRMRPELVAMFPRLWDRWRFSRRQLRTLVTAPLSLRNMGARARLMATLNLTDDCARITAPTLLVTGEPALDRVVPVGSTLAYARLIRGARSVVIAGTGHFGAIARPDTFTAIVGDFVKTALREGSDPYAA